MLVGALGMAAKGSGNGIMDRVRGWFGGAKTTADPNDAPTLPKAARGSPHHQLAETLAAAHAIPAAARPSHPASAPDKTVDPYGALLGTTVIVKLSLAFAKLIDKLDIHQAIGISQSVVRAVAMNPACIEGNNIPAQIVREAMAAHDVFTDTEATVALPTIDAKLAGLLRRAYNDLYDRIENESKLGLEPGEDQKLRQARVASIAEYYLHNRINKLMTLFQIRLDQFTDEQLRIEVKEIELDLSCIKDRLNKFYGFKADKSMGMELIGGRNVSLKRLAHALGIDEMPAHNFLRANRETLTAYVREWENMSFASQLCYRGGFEEFVAQDMMPGGTNAIGFDIPPSIDHGRRALHRTKLAEQSLLAANKPELASLVLKRTITLSGRSIAIVLLAKELNVSISRTIGLLERYESELQRIKHHKWNDPRIRDGAGYERVVARALRDLIGRDAVAVEAAPRRRPSSTPPGGARRAAGPLLGVRVFEELDSDDLVDDDEN
jgi:hypothetical protein